MSKITENVDNFISELLHIEDSDKNKLISLDSGNNSKIFYLSKNGTENLSKYAIEVIRNRIGKPGNTVLRKSSVAVGYEQIVGSDINEFEWADGNGVREAAVLHKFIDGVYCDLNVKGNNPLFLSIGAVTWKIVDKDGTVKKVRSPLLLFPIKLVRPSGVNSLVYIEFVNDDIYLNPCFLAKLETIAGEKTVKNFPHPCGEVDDPIDIESLVDSEDYFERVKTYVDEQGREDISADTVFCFDKNVVAVLQYNHDELCMYYDIKRNKEKIYSHPSVNRIFTENTDIPSFDTAEVFPQFIAQRDSVQERIVKRVLAGESLIVKGPPGTGKTLTITNLISSLIADGKKVLLSSQKTAAMTEVYNKLPERLKRFVMLLDAETETQAAKLGAIDVKKNFNELLKERKTGNFPSSVYDDLSFATAKLNSAIGNIGDYYDTTFGDRGLFCGNYYSALDVLCKIDADPVLFALPNDVASLSKEGYNALYKKVEDASVWFAKIAPSHCVIKNLWWSVNGGVETFDEDGAVEYNSKTAELFAEIKKISDGAFSDVCEGYDNLTLSVAEFLSTTDIAESQAAIVFDKEKSEKVFAVIELYRELQTGKTVDFNVETLSPAEVKKIADGLENIPSDVDFTKSRFEEIYRDFEVLLLLNDKTKIDLLFTASKTVDELNGKIENAENDFYYIFRSDITEEDKKIIEESVKSFEKYFDGEFSAPKLLDFKCKRYFERLRTLGYGKPLEFKSVADGVKLYSSISGYVSAKEDIKTKVSSHLRRVLTNGQIETLLYIASALGGNEEKTVAFLSRLFDGKELIKKAFDSVDGDCTLSELKAAFVRKTTVEELKNALGELGVSVGETDDCIEFARNLYYTDKAVKSKILGASVKEFLEKAKAIREKSDGLGALIINALERINGFADRYFENYYTETFQDITLGDIGIYLLHATDKKIISAVKEYASIVSDEGKISVGRFFRPFEFGVRERGGYTFCEHFEHSVYFLAVKYMQALMQDRKNGLCEKANKSFEDFVSATEKINEVNVSVIEKLCMERVNPNDDDFAFLHSERSVGQSLRKMFKLHAKAILKLKKCFILSPSTASMLFVKDDFSDFDVVIIDEASQLRPTSVLPLLFRAKQVVLVGDEWQMPPIKHFSSNTERAFTDSEGEVKLLSPNTSVLGLALENCAFRIEQLICHYRSKTETLISFSQERFYPQMRTFPAPCPKADGLGFNDVFIPNGRCVEGVNEEEAVAVVKELNSLFDRYYDNEKCILTQSVGVVSFGQKQRDYIVSAVKRDGALSSKIKKALANFNDVAEKLIFFKTIETVQGQETDHIILSVTYGKNKDGKTVQSFGELNYGFDDDKLGECIFNVAVTRAKSSVTVVHSLAASEIHGQRVEYIGKYLDTVGRFKDEGKSQWGGKSVCETQGFIRQVVDFISECGVASERIVVDCGANKGSVKIPVVILSKDLTVAELAVWCEQPPKREYDYVDYNIRYVESLKNRGWQIARLFINDWVNNTQAEKENLKKIINKYVK